MKDVTKFSLSGLQKIRSSNDIAFDYMVCYADDDFEITVYPDTPRHHYIVSLSSLFEFGQIDCEINIKGVDGVNRVIKNMYTRIKDGEFDQYRKPKVEQPEQPKKVKRGGARTGAGRKKGLETKLVRVPVCFEDQVKDYIEQLKSQLKS